MDMFLDVFSAGCLLFTAIIAWYSLNSWKDQLKVNLKIKFLDGLTGEIFYYNSEIRNCIDVLKFFIVDIEYKSYDVQQEKTYSDESGIVKYIKAHGVERSKLIFNYLDKARLVSSRIEALMIKGQFYGFDEFENLSESIKGLFEVGKGIESYAFILGNDSMYLANEDIQKSLAKIVNICPSEIKVAKDKAETNCLDIIKTYYAKVIG